MQAHRAEDLLGGLLQVIGREDVRWVLKEAARRIQIKRGGIEPPLFRIQHLDDAG